MIADEAGNPFTHAVLDRILHNVLVFEYGKAFASLFSWHSYRSGLCCALFAAGCPDAINQLICRWMCPGRQLKRCVDRKGVACDGRFHPERQRAKGGP